MLGDMSVLQVPPRPAYVGEPPSQAGLLERDRALRGAQAHALGEVNRLVRTQAELGEALAHDIASLQAGGASIDLLERKNAQSGLLSQLVRTFSGRSAVLERRSATQALLRTYETASVRLRRAAAFADELQLCALSLQRDVGHVQQEWGAARDNARRAEERLAALREAQRTLERSAHGLDAFEADSLRDQLRFERNQEEILLSLYQATARICEQNVPKTRDLRDTVMSLHADMTRYVTTATGQLDAAGRHLQALGLAADAATVLRELHESMLELTTALEVTEDYLGQTKRLLADTLPALQARIDAQRELSALGDP